MGCPALTARLRFRAWRDEDLPLALGLWGDPRVTAMIDARTPLSRAQVAALLAQHVAWERADGVQYWPVFCRESDAHVGCCGLRPRAPEVYELGVQIRADRWGRGYATEAARAAIAHAFHVLGAQALFAGHHPDNDASRRLLARLGFRHTHDERYPPTGRMHPSYRLAPRVRLRPSAPGEPARFTAFETDPAAAPYVNTYAPAEHARMAAREDVTYLSIDEDGALAGFLILVLDPDGTSVELRRIVVTRRDRGIGRQALLAAARWCAAHHPARTRLWLDVAPDNARARHLYEALGFAYCKGAEPDVLYLERPLETT